MSDSREAYAKWREDKGIRISDDPIPATELWDAAWQAAQAQAVSVTENQISEGIFGWELRNYDGHNLSMDDTDEIAEYIMKQAREVGNE